MVKKLSPEKREAILARLDRLSPVIKGTLVALETPSRLVLMRFKHIKQEFKAIEAELRA